MEQHRLTPYRIKGYNCDKCHKRFTTPNALQSHMVYHSDEKFECNICGKILKSKANIKNHIMQIHIRKETYICPHCGKISKSKGNLQQHINKIHLQLRPFACTVCPKKFKSAQQNEAHMRTHTGNSS